MNTWLTDSGGNRRGADLSGADLRSADLSGANLRSADLSGVEYFGSKEEAQRAAAAPRFIKLTADGSQLPPDTTDYAGIFNIRDGIVTAYASPNDLTQARAETACAKLAQIPGYTPWKLISDKDGELIVDRRFHNPAFDPDEYPHIVPVWHWTDTRYKPSSSGSAWGLGFCSGSVDYYGRVNRLRALAVCRPVPVSQ